MYFIKSLINKDVAIFATVKKKKKKKLKSIG